MPTKEGLIELLQGYARENPHNSFAALGCMQEPMWREPLVGFAFGADPLFSFFKQDIGAFYLTPAEAFARKYPLDMAAPDELTVVSMAFAQTAETLREQKKQTAEPGARWMLSRNTWARFCGWLYDRLEEAFDKEGLPFVIPDRLPDMRVLRSEKYGRAAVWSQRHTAMAAGLGTFGLCDGLITERGKAVRLMSFIIRHRLEPDARPYDNPFDWCLFYRDKSCGLCIRRCPAGAISASGHDKEKCAAYLEEMDRRKADDPLFDGTQEVGCGLCQSGVPCEHRRPF